MDGDVGERLLLIVAAEVRHDLGLRRLPAHAVLGDTRSPGLPLLGAAGQYAVSARISLAAGRSEFRKTVAGDWTSRAGREELPFVHAMTGQLADYDDRLQFAAGVDLILAAAAAIPRA